MKNRLIVAVALFITAFWQVSEAKATDPLSLLIETALANNPELKSSQARWQMYSGKVKQAGALEDPMLMLKLQNMLVRQPFSTGGNDPATAKVIGITQQLPFWGKRAIKEEVAQLEAESYRWQIEERRLELTRMVKETWYQIYAVDKALDIVSKNIRIISDFVTIAESRYSVGQGVQQDIFKAGLEKSKMLEMQVTLQQRRKSLVANLNYLLYRPIDEPVGKIPDFELPKLTMSAEQLNQTAFEKRPQIKSFTMLSNKGEAAHRLAQKEFYPDFNLSFEYMLREASMNDPGYNMYSLALTFNLPLQRERRHAMLAESSSGSTMALEELNALKNSISYNISDALAQLERRQKLVELYKGGIIPQAEQSLESAVISYRVGKVDFLTLLDGRVTLFNYERELYDSKAEFMMQLARLEAVVGGIQKQWNAEKAD